MLSKSAFSVLEKPGMSPAPERYGLMKKKTCKCPGPGILGSVTSVRCIHSDVVFRLLYPSGQSSSDAFLDSLQVDFCGI